ncbi:glutamine-hydrolyzing carbamoyl-phosphate synthase small subunit [candidate division KSB1 bacterium]|nr:glutamine-hydrolyzing carbamoyl-phosphate synthase small subunit [candidate division KSB1 bacterium]
MNSILQFENGRIFEGISCGNHGEVIGEVVFNTGMAGYQEILTDPSYCGQIVTMTYPHIGNYGINLQDYESRNPFLEGLIVYESSKLFSSWRGQIGLSDFLRRYQIVAIEDVDTRAITRMLRDEGSMKGIISTYDFDSKSLAQKIEMAPDMIGRNLVSTVSTRSRYEWEPEVNNYEIQQFLRKRNSKRYRVAVLDFGVKWNILRVLYTIGFDISVFPSNTTFDELSAFDPDAIFLSNGPGDPEPITNAIETISCLIGKYPIMGICLGHQLLGIALKGKSFKMKFGHHGVNHPVKNLETGKVEITSQNHGFAIDSQSFNELEIKVTHLNLNDGTLEGFRHLKYPLFAVQYHPESGPGPHDSRYLFGQFYDMVKQHKEHTPIYA